MAKYPRKGISLVKANESREIAVVPPLPRIQYKTDDDLRNAFRQLFEHRQRYHEELHRLCYRVPEEDRAPYLNALERFIDNQQQALIAGAKAGFFGAATPVNDSKLEIIWPD